MPADEAEIHEAEKEGVKFVFLAAPMEIATENGRARGIRLQKMKLGEPDAGGRRSPVPEQGAEEYIAADSVIAAIGQDVNTHGLELLKSIKTDNDFRTQQKGVFAIGDVTGRSAYAIDAIGHGRKAAAAIHMYLQQEATHWEILPNILVREEKTEADYTDIEKTSRNNERYKLSEGKPQPGSLGIFTAEEAAREALRCLSCGCNSYHECGLIKLANAYDSKADIYPAAYHRKPGHMLDTRNPHIYRDMNKCVLCGLCVRVCHREGHDLLSAVNRGFETTVGTAFGQALPEEQCRGCGECVGSCPTGAITPGRLPFVI
jgi:formate dehydrogenase major subunit